MSCVLVRMMLWFLSGEQKHWKEEKKVKILLLLLVKEELGLEPQMLP